MGTVTLIYADRCRRRIRLADDAGKPFLLNLERPMRLADGDGLQLMGHGFIRRDCGTRNYCWKRRPVMRCIWHALPGMSATGTRRRK